MVTANKALLAEHGPELFDRARELGRSIAFEASVAGGIPIIANISQCLSANQIESMHGILNGTSNFILTQMEEQRTRLRRRRSPRPSGWATPRPIRRWTSTARDAAQKLAILAHLAFGARVHWSEIPADRNRHARRGRHAYAKELGYRIKLLAVAAVGAGRPGTARLAHAGATSARRWPRSAGPYNAIRVVGDAVGRVFFHGLGAGQMPTASAVVADLIDTVVGRTAITFRTLELWSRPTTRSGRRPRSCATCRAAIYLRFNVDDRPGVHGRDRRRAGPARHLDRLGHPARSRRRGRPADRVRW